MYEIGLESLQQIMREARAAAKYAREHYDLLASREKTYTLYGPEADFIGACIPSSMTPSRARNLLPKTHRKNYVIYELDEAYLPLRTIHVLDYNKVNLTYHHFTYNGISYAYPFRGRGNEIATDDIAVLKLSEDRTQYFALASRNLLFIQFYTYESENTMSVSTYRYFPTAKYTIHGYPVDWNAPIGALNSPVQRNCYQEPVNNIDFSRWFHAESCKSNKG